MPDIQKVPIIGSGFIVIGQAAEFGYAGSQACRALREDGVTTIYLTLHGASRGGEPAPQGWRIQWANQS